MNELILTLSERKAQLIQEFITHIQISAISVLLAIIISVPLAIIFEKNKLLSNISLQSSAIMQTIPSLALLGLLIPLVGIGKIPAIITLVIYAIFPILNATYAGLKQINPVLEEAAEAFGLTKFEKLKKYRLPLALPVIISGIRTSTVMIIGTATLAALIGAGGLGTFILLGIDRNNNSLILIGAISSAILAIAAHYLIAFIQKSNAKTITIIFTAALLATIYSFSASYKPQQEENIKIAGKLGTEPEILINLYKILLEENTNLKVQIMPNFGKTTFLYNALKRGDIDIYPEFTGTVISTILPMPEFNSTNPSETYIEAKNRLQKEKLLYLNPAEFQNTYAIVVKEDYAKQHNLETISDIIKVENNATAGFTLEFNDRKDGNLGLKQKYNLNLKVQTLEPALRYIALENGQTQIADAYSTDSEIKQYKLKILKDDKELFPAYQSAPLMQIKLADKYPSIIPALNKLAGKISEEQMSEMNYEVKIKNQPAAKVARDFLIKEKIISP